MEPIAVEGPVTGGSRGRPWSLPPFDLAERGYVAEEFFVSGKAVSYRYGSEPTEDGRWSAEEDETAPFRTRILVARPSDASRFNGTVVLHWLNVTAGYELGVPDDEELLSGYAWVGVSAQKVGIDGFAPGAPAYRGRQAPNPALKAWDPLRYESLSHPGDRWSYDIFTQAARAVTDEATTSRTMGGLRVERRLATGASQSGARLTTYINAVHLKVGLFDGFLVTIIGGRGSHLGDPVVRPDDPPAARLGLPTRIRDDLDVPVFALNSECEAISMFPMRRDDDERYRFWEVAGAPHVVAVVPASRPDGRIDNPLSYRPIQAAAFRHLQAWVRDGTAHPASPASPSGPTAPSSAMAWATRWAGSVCRRCRHRCSSTTGAMTRRKAWAPSTAGPGRWSPTWCAPSTRTPRPTGRSSWKQSMPWWAAGHCARRTRRPCERAMNRSRTGGPPGVRTVRPPRRGCSR